MKKASQNERYCTSSSQSLSPIRCPKPEMFFQFITPEDLLATINWLTNPLQEVFPLIYTFHTKVLIPNIIQTFWSMKSLEKNSKNLKI